MVEVVDADTPPSPDRKNPLLSLEMPSLPHMLAEILGPQSSHSPCPCLQLSFHSVEPKQRWLERLPGLACMVSE